MRTLCGAIALSLLVAGACGGNPDYSADPPPPHPGPLAEPSASAAASEPGTPPASSVGWSDLADDAALQGYMEAQARAQLAKDQPGLKQQQLDAYRAKPGSAPGLSGKAVERLMDLAAIDLARGRLDQAEGTITLVRERAKNRNSAFSGNTFLCEIARRRAGSDQKKAVTAVAAVLRTLPRTRLGSSTVVFQLFQKQAQLDARLQQAKKQLLSLDTAGKALVYGQILPGIVAHRAVFLDAASIVQKEQARLPKAKDYAFGTVDLKWAKDAKPVKVAVWDLGTNPALFQKQLYKNPKEQPNGKDDDNNGLVDDISGLTDEGLHTQLLFEPAKEILTRFKPFLRGIMDLRAGIASSADAKKVLTLMAGVKNADEQEELEKKLSAVGEWAHGSHVAGIMLAGVPKAQLAIFRSVWAGEARVYHHRGPTDAELDGETKNVENIARFINDHGIAVVNASLGFTVEYLEDQLRHEAGKYKTDAEVKARARKVHARRRSNWRLVFERCPKTLFVVAAGNSNQDVVEYGVVPADSQQTNVLVVGAVDRFGSWATFTNSNPSRVKVFDHGVEVDSLIPSGETVPLSGTSMASPNVANLAAKLFSVHPGLTPSTARELIERTGDPIAPPFNGKIANETRAIAEARKLRGK